MGWCQAVSERSQAGVSLSPRGKSQGLMPGVAIYGKVLHHCTSESLTLSNTPIPNVTGCYSTEVLMLEKVLPIFGYRYLALLQQIHPLSWVLSQLVENFLTCLIDIT